MANTKES
jgi:hypothetical protein